MLKNEISNKRGSTLQLMDTIALTSSSAPSAPRVETRPEFPTHRILVLDTETSGLPITPGFGSWYEPYRTEYYTNARVIQIALVAETEQHSWFIRPENFTITNSQFHGITQEKAMDGVAWDTMVVELFEVLGRYDLIVGHNVMFDIYVIAAELYARGQHILAQELLSKQRDCTMRMGKYFLGLSRVPKLTVLYETLFKQPFMHAHNAVTDSQVTWDCYMAMTHRSFTPKYVLLEHTVYRDPDPWQVAFSLYLGKGKAILSSLHQHIQSQMRTVSEKLHEHILDGSATIGGNALDPEFGRRVDAGTDTGTLNGDMEI